MSDATLIKLLRSNYPEPTNKGEITKRHAELIQEMYLHDLSIRQEIKNVNPFYKNESNRNILINNDEKKINNQRSSLI